METTGEVSVPAVNSNQETQAVPEVQSARSAAKTRLQKAQEAGEKALAQQQAVLAKWADEGRQFVGQLDTAQWQIGDWLLAGQRYYPKKKVLKAAEAITGYSTTTLYATLQVSKAFEISERSEFSVLSWEHFHAVSGKKMDHKKALELLRDATERHLPAVAMKKEMRAPKPEAEGQRVTFRIPDSGYDRLRTLAYARHNRDGDSPAVLEEIVLAALYEYFVNPAVAKEIEDFEAEIVAEEIKREMAAANDGKVAWKVIEGIMRELTDGKDERPDPEEVRERFEKSTHRVKGYEEPQEWEFTYRIFLSALKKSRTFAKYFSESTAHDFGVNTTFYKKPHHHSGGMTKSQAVANSALIIAEHLPQALTGEWQTVGVVREAVESSIGMPLPGQFDAAFEQALKAAKKDGKVKLSLVKEDGKLVTGMVRKLEEAAPAVPVSIQRPLREPPMSVAEYDRLHANDPE